MCNAAASFVATFLLGMYSAVAGTVYVAAKAAHANRLEAERRRAALPNQRPGAGRTYHDPRRGAQFQQNYDAGHMD